MTGIIIVTHGKLAQALLGTAEMIMGLQEHIGAIGFEAGQNVADLQEKLCQTLQKNAKEDEALILVDLQGGSPYNAAAMLAMTRPKVKVVTGVNLPMLLGILPSRDLDVVALSQLAVESGQSGVNEFVLPIGE
jgi:PTS system mannose-specific IIA component